MPKEDKSSTFLFVILLDSIINVDKKNHPQVFLEDCKYAVKKKKIMSTISEELILDGPDESNKD